MELRRYSALLKRGEGGGESVRTQTLSIHLNLAVEVVEIHTSQTNATDNIIATPTTQLLQSQQEQQASSPSPNLLVQQSNVKFQQ